MCLDINPCVNKCIGERRDTARTESSNKSTLVPDMRACSGYPPARRLQRCVAFGLREIEMKQLTYCAVTFALAAGGFGSAAAQNAQTEREASNHDPDTHVVETEVPALTAPDEVTEAEIQVEEPLNVRDDLPRAPGEREEPPQPSHGLTLTEDEAAELVGRELHSADGDEVGEIVGLSRSLHDQSVHLLVDVGGFLGVGERTISVPLEQVTVDDLGNVAAQMSRDDIESAEEHDPTQYASIEEAEGGSRQ